MRFILGFIAGLALGYGLATMLGKAGEHDTYAHPQHPQHA
jgi:hypothetical protein